MAHWQPDYWKFETNVPSYYDEYLPTYLKATSFPSVIVNFNVDGKLAQTNVVAADASYGVRSAVWRALRYGTLLRVIDIVFNGPVQVQQGYPLEQLQNRIGFQPSDPEVTVVIKRLDLCLIKNASSQMFVALVDIDHLGETWTISYSVENHNMPGFQAALALKENPTSDDFQLQA